MTNNNIINSFRGQYDFLSNFYQAEVEVDGRKYPTVENAFQAMKTTNKAERVRFENVSPAEARSLGRHVDLRTDWEEVKVQIMIDLLSKKFADGSVLRAKLDATSGSELIEGNTWHDNFWGSCTCSRCSKKAGKNMLGRILMELRDNHKPKQEHPKEKVKSKVYEIIDNAFDEAHFDRGFGAGNQVVYIDRDSRKEYKFRGWKKAYEFINAYDCESRMWIEECLETIDLDFMGYEPVKQLAIRSAAIAGFEELGWYKLLGSEEDINFRSKDTDEVMSFNTWEEANTKCCEMLKAFYEKQSEEEDRAPWEEVKPVEKKPEPEKVHVPATAYVDTISDYVGLDFTDVDDLQNLNQERGFVRDGYHRVYVRDVQKIDSHMCKNGYVTKEHLEITFYSEETAEFTGKLYPGGVPGFQRCMAYQTHGASRFWKLSEIFAYFTSHEMEVWTWWHDDYGQQVSFAKRNK